MTIYTALSGLVAASTRLSVSADNVANMRSLGFQRNADGSDNGGFQPKQVQQTSLSTGGVVARPIPVDPASVTAYEPSSPDADGDGLVPRPNVDLGQEFVNQILAEQAYKASAQMIRAEDKRSEVLLNMVS